MFSFLSKLVNSAVGKDSLVWHKELGSHSCGEYSFAAAQASRAMDECSQVETGHNGMFVGIYDGHGGGDAASELNERLFNNITRCARSDHNITEETLKNAIAMTEEDFLNRVRNFRRVTPPIQCAGSCCLIGLIWKETLFIGNLGDSRAVIGIADGSDDDRIIAQQLTTDHNVNQPEVRQEVQILNRHDQYILFYRDGRWRIKDIIEVSRSIGDAYLKAEEFRGRTLPAQYQFAGPLVRPIISATPFVHSRGIQPTDRFLIFASRGLWDQLTIQEAVDMVNNNPKKGIAKRLVKAAQKEAARRANMGYRKLLMIGKGRRRDVHDDMTVAVVFIDHELVGHSNDDLHGTSIKGFGDTVGISDFYEIHDLM